MKLPGEWNDKMPFRLISKSLFVMPKQYNLPVKMDGDKLKETCENKDFKREIIRAILEEMAV
jgi:hypothetical protein